MLEIKAVIFDLGGVIVPLDFPRGYARIGSLCHLPPAEIRQRIASTGLVELFETGRIEPEVFAREISAALNLSLSYPRFCEMWSSIFPSVTLIPDDLLASLRGRYRVLLLSNTNAIHFAYIQRNYSVMRHFDDFVLSHEVGVMKPQPRIYKEAIARAGCLPEQCFFTDDVPENVEGARREGMRAAQFVSLNGLKQDFQNHAIDFDCK